MAGRRVNADGGLEQLPAREYMNETRTRTWLSPVFPLISSAYSRLILWYRVNLCGRSRSSHNDQQHQGVTSNCLHRVCLCYDVSFLPGAFLIVSSTADLYICRLFGITCLQAYLYYMHYPRDALPLKLTVRIVLPTFAG